VVGVTRALDRRLSAWLRNGGSQPRTFKNAAYLNQAREVFGNRWKSAVLDAVNRNDPTGCLYSTRDRRTVVLFHVGREGDVSGVRIGTSSGLQYLDQVALEAVKGGQLPPPPEALIDQELPFAFTLQAVKDGTCPVKGSGSP